MPDDPRVSAGSGERPYTVYRGGGASRGRSETGAGAGERPYTTYRAGRRSLRARLRGEPEAALDGHGGPGRDAGRRFPVRRMLKYLALAIVFWLLLSLVLFMVSAQIETGKLPTSASSALAGGGNMVTSADTVLILGTDQRPRVGANSKEPGANHSDVGANSDTIMLWRIGGGVSRRLSIPRDTVAHIPGHGLGKINAGYAIGGPALAIKTVERFTGVQINHVIIVNLGAFPQFIDAVGGVDVQTGRICSDISGGVKNGGFSLYLQPGAHHLSGIEALTYARTRENKCNPRDSDLTRVRHQQQILNAIKSRLLSVGAFFRLPWASWDAPKVLRTDMGGPSLMSLFVAAEMGGNVPVQVLKPSGAEALPGYGAALTVRPSAVRAAVNRLMNG